MGPSGRTQLLTSCLDTGAQRSLVVRLEPTGFDPVERDVDHGVPAPPERAGHRAVLVAEVEVREGWVVGVEGAWVGAPVIGGAEVVDGADVGGGVAGADVGGAGVGVGACVAGTTPAVSGFTRQLVIRQSAQYEALRIDTTAAGYMTLDHDWGKNVSVKAAGNLMTEISGSAGAPKLFG